MLTRMNYFLHSGMHSIFCQVIIISRMNEDEINLRDSEHETEKASELREDNIQRRLNLHKKK